MPIRSSIMVIMNRLSKEKQANVLRLLVEGTSIRAISRITGVNKNTVTKLLCDVGSKCLDYQDEALRNLPCRRLQCDEVWSFCCAKEKNVPEEMQGQFGIGDVWTWTAICSETKLVPCWHIGRRSAMDARTFIDDLASRLSSRIQITTDGHKAYLEAIEGAFGCEVDFGMLVKIYGGSQESERRCSPAEWGAEKHIIAGKPDVKHISTSFVEWQNLTMRMSMRRFTRLTNAFSKKVENLAHAVSLHFMYYNFCRIHQSLRMTPAMKAGVSSHIWEIEEIVALLD
jgi:IS1 family transposase